MPHLRKLAAVSIVFAALFVTLPLALGHARPKVMDPAPDTTVAAPSKITVTFSEAIEGKFSSLSVTDEQGKKIGKEASQPLSGDPKTLTLALPAQPSGGYLVHWVSVAADGHRMEGTYKFTVK